MRCLLRTIVLFVVFLSGMLSCKESKSLDNDEPVKKAEPIALIPSAAFTLPSAWTGMVKIGPKCASPATQMDP